MSLLDNSSILITGGTGSLGKALVKELLENSKVRRIAIFSRDELKQHNFRNEIKDDPRLRWFIGDVRDLERLKRAMHNVDFVIHTAALKQVDTGEYNPMEFIKTNVLGSQNVIDAAIETGVKRVVALSTDKASSPINLYGATKLCSDKLMIAGNSLSRQAQTKFSVVRYGNVLGSRGSVVPFFMEMAKLGSIPVTDPRMTRFWLTLDRGVQLVLESLRTMHGGEIFIPKIPSFRVIDVAKVVAPGIPLEIIGIRPGEKLHEIMITEDDAFYTREFQNHFAILSPALLNSGAYEDNGKPVDESFSYRSDTNPWWHTDITFRNELREINLV